MKIRLKFACGHSSSVMAVDKMPVFLDGEFGHSEAWCRKCQAKSRVTTIRQLKDTAKTPAETTSGRDQAARGEATVMRQGRPRDVAARHWKVG